MAELDFKYIVLLEVNESLSAQSVAVYIFKVNLCSNNYVVELCKFQLFYVNLC